MSTNPACRDDDPFGWWRHGQSSAAERAYHDILSASSATERPPAVSSAHRGRGQRGDLHARHRS
jgi:hypothetical protein